MGKHILRLSINDFHQQISCDIFAVIECHLCFSALLSTPPNLDENKVLDLLEVAY